MLLKDNNGKIEMNEINFGKDNLKVKILYLLIEGIVLLFGLGKMLGMKKNLGLFLLGNIKVRKIEIDIYLFCKLEKGKCKKKLMLVFNSKFIWYYFSFF